MTEDRAFELDRGEELPVGASDAKMESKTEALGGVDELDGADGVGEPVAGAVAAAMARWTDDFNAWAFVDELLSGKNLAAPPNGEADDNGARAMGTSPSLDGSGAVKDKRNA